MYDKNIPIELLNLQKWFAKTITTPLKDNQIQGGFEAREFIKPNKDLSAKERIEIYNQQYWWRLIETLRKNFPLLSRLFGRGDFTDQIAVPYLYAYPPRHFSLALLGNELSDWIQNSYNQEDRMLVLHAAQVDFAYQELAFTAKKSEFFELPYDLFSFRFSMLKQSIEYWEKNDFPKLKKGSFRFQLVRNEKHQIIASKV